MDIQVDGKPKPIVEVGRLFGVDIYNPDSPIGSTLTISDKMHGRMIRFAAACTVTVPTGLRRDFSCGWSQDGSHPVTFVAADGVTVQSLDDLTDTGGQYAIGGLAAFSSMADDTAVLFRLFGSLA